MAPKTATPHAKTDAAPAATNGEALTISEYLISRLHDEGRGIDKIFGIPGDYILAFYEDLTNSPIDVVVCTKEDCAGFAADAYARLRGLGAVAVTYCVGGLSLVNSVAGAYAEKSPLVVISGAPALNERRANRLLHHQVKDHDTQRQVFEKITIANAVLDDPLTALREIDRVLEAVKRYKRPGYIEIPRDMIHVRPPYAPRPPHQPTSDPDELAEALAEALGLLAKAQRPMLMVGVEVHRFGLQDVILEFAEKHQLPICSTLLGKSAVSESHPLCIGVYAGGMGKEVTRKYVEESDCVLMVGTFMTDINLGIFTDNLDPSKCILATSETLQVSRHHYRNVVLEEFVRALSAEPFTCVHRPLPEGVNQQLRPYEPVADAKTTVNRLSQKINSILTDEMIVICDVGDSLFAAVDLVMRRRTEFLGPAYYTSMGYAIPAALGASCAEPRSRPLVLVGDGAFQMTGMELSTILRFGFSPIIIVLNNHGYTTERYLLDGPFNDITDWSYHKVVDLLGGGKGYEVKTEGELETALGAALEDRSGFSLLNVQLDKMDRSETLERLARELSKRMKSNKG